MIGKMGVIAALYELADRIDEKVFVSRNLSWYFEDGAPRPLRFTTLTRSNIINCYYYYIEFLSRLAGFYADHVNYPLTGKTLDEYKSFPPWTYASLCEAAGETPLGGFGDGKSFSKSFMLSPILPREFLHHVEKILPFLRYRDIAVSYQFKEQIIDITLEARHTSSNPHYPGIIYFTDAGEGDKALVSALTSRVNAAEWQDVVHDQTPVDGARPRPRCGDSVRSRGSNDRIDEITRLAQYCRCKFGLSLYHDYDFSIFARPQIFWPGVNSGDSVDTFRAGEFFPSAASITEGKFSVIMSGRIGATADKNVFNYTPWFGGGAFPALVALPGYGINANAGCSWGNVWEGYSYNIIIDTNSKG